MSKIDDLMAAFKTGFRDRLQGPGIRPEGDIAIRAGIIAVVTALRDELLENVAQHGEPVSYGDIHCLFHEILGDAVEKVGTPKITLTCEGGGGWGQMTTTAPAPEHDWFEYKPNLVTCKACGIVRRADGKNSPCKGVVGVGLRAATPTTDYTGGMNDLNVSPETCEWEGGELGLGIRLRSNSGRPTVVR